jgi:hypothetical protein
VDPDPLLRVAGELYALPPGDFIAGRKEHSAQAKAAGDTGLAARVGRLKKPSAAAWVVNQLMRHQAEQMGQLLDLGASLRQAQADLDAGALRELGKQRRQVTAAVSRQGREVAEGLGVKVSEPVARQVEDTLHAAMVDEDAAAAVRSGLLTEALSPNGLGAFKVEGVVADPAAIGRTAAPAEQKRAELSVVPDDTTAVDKAADALAASEKVTRKARKELDKAAERVAKHEARTLQLQASLDEVRRQAAELEHALDQTADKREAAEDDRDHAAHAMHDAERDEGTARARLDYFKNRA